MDDGEARLRALLSYLGVQDALKELGAQTPCRFAAVFEVVDGFLLNRYFHDKRGEPMPQMLVRVPFKESFCNLALSEGELRCANSATDSRMDYSPYKGVMLAYHAVPVIDQRRALTGTLCVFDYDEAHLSDEQFARLVMLAKLLPPVMAADRWRHVAAGPAPAIPQVDPPEL